MWLTFIVERLIWYHFEIKKYLLFFLMLFLFLFSAVPVSVFLSVFLFFSPRLWSSFIFIWLPVMKPQPRILQINFILWVLLLKMSNERGLNLLQEKYKDKTYNNQTHKLKDRHSLKPIHTRTQAFFFLSLCCMRISVFEAMSVLPIDRYQNATPRSISLHELQKVQLQERFTLVTQDSIGHLKTLCMSVFTASSGVWMQTLQLIAKR